MNEATRRNQLPLANFGVSIGAFGIGALMAVMQSLSRADLDVAFRSPEVYYVSVTAHGVLMALVFTTFFIMGLGYVIARRTLGRLESEAMGWSAFWVATIGSLLTALTILSGEATVLYTFYPPLQAHPLFYIGATLLIVGSWIWCVVMIRTWLAWRRENRNGGKVEPLPLAMHAMLTSVIIWLLATSGLAAEVLGQLVPWSLGWIERIDPIVARTWFWWFGHPLTYFWLLPTYMLWYTVLPEVAGGRLFSDRLARVVFVMFILFSTPVGFHHQFTDPGIPASWKLVHTATTYAILFPSLITAFTVIASLEIAGRLRGATGLFNWIWKLPWREPFFACIALAMITFAVGGWGGAINAAFAMNTMVHNTAWIHGHFHLTVGTAVALSFMGASYWLLPRLSGRALMLREVATIQPYLWFFGMVMFAWTSHVTGLLGEPRRVYSSNFAGSEASKAWENLTMFSALGGMVLFVSSLCFIAVVAATMIWGKHIDPPSIEFARPLHASEQVTGGELLWDRLGLWTAVAVLLIIIAYAYPMYHLFSLERFGSPGFRPF